MYSFRLLFALVLLIPAAATGQQSLTLLPRPPKPWPQVMVVGTVHFANPGRDAVKSDLDDVLAPRRQAEIESVVSALARFRPTKILVERPPGAQATLDQRLRDLRAGSYQLSRDEVDQIALRLAGRLEHDRIHAIDSRLDLDINRVMGFAMQNGQQQLAGEFGAIMQRVERHFAQLFATSDMATILAAQNNDVDADDGVALYQLMARIGRDTSYVGADVASDWYRRNMRIYANVLRLVEPNDRVLVLIGGGHRPLLRQLLMQTPGIEFVPTLPFLRP